MTGLAARLEGKSSLVRLGLLTHSTAGWIDPGFSGHVTLDLSNVANLPIVLWPGMKIVVLSDTFNPCYAGGTRAPQLRADATRVGSSNIKLSVEPLLPARAVRPLPRSGTPHDHLRTVTSDRRPPHVTVSSSLIHGALGTVNPAQR